MQILFVGDIFGKPGRDIARRAIPALVDQRGIDFIIANVENSAAGFGVTGDIAETILGYGVDAARAAPAPPGERPRRRSWPRQLRRPHAFR